VTVTITSFIQINVLNHIWTKVKQSQTFADHQQYEITPCYHPPKTSKHTLP